MFIFKRCCCPSKKSSCCSLNALSKLSSDLTLLAVKSRLEILFLLQAKPHCVCDLMTHTNMSQSLISHHLRDLENSGVIASTRDGKFIDYHLTDKGKRVIEALKILVNK